MIRSIIICCLLFSLLLLSTSCPRKLTKCDHRGITVFNNSSKKIFGYSLPLINTNPSPKIYHGDPERLSIYPLSTNDYIFEPYDGTNNCISDVLKEWDTFRLNVYFFDDSVLMTTPWDTIIARNLYLKKDSFNYREIVNRNWRIEYP